LCRLKTLQVLDLSDNELEGNLPQCWANLTSLKSIILHSNQFVGDIALSPLVNMTSLQVLELSDNNFQIPLSFKSFFNHSRLKLIYCEYCDFLLETDEFQASVPSFQLNGISLSDLKLINNNATIPKFLYHQHNLKFIDLQNISFSGNNFLWLIENNTELLSLTLKNIAFTGPLQMPSNPIPNLTELDISSNHISGNIPEDIGTSFPGLTTLAMSANSFTGTIPSSFGDMASLVHLDLSHNLLSGNIPNRLGMGCLSLEILRLSNNNLQGSILPAHHNLAMLRSLELDVNKFTTIPNSLSSCSKLDVLKINLNHLDGPFPTTICQLKFLQHLDISENNITGILPACFSPPDMTFAKLSKNRLQGLFHAFFNCTRLQVLDLSHNQFTGPIPKWFDSLSSLGILLLNNNHFEGEILSQFCELSELSLINLSNNSLSGGVPPCLGNITFGPSVIQENNIIEGLMAYEEFFADEFIPFVTKSVPLIYEGRTLNEFSAIDLSCNNLAGHIPPEIGRLFHLKSLNLSHNSLSGTIPITFANLTGIESLDLSYNSLTGNIPSQLANLDSLEVFNVSFNNLSGPIPQGPHFQTFDGMSYVSNQLLCGKPVSRNCTDPESTPVTPRTRKGTEFMDMETFYVSFAAAYITMLLGVLAVLCINPYWRRAWFHLVELRPPEKQASATETPHLQKLRQPMSLKNANENQSATRYKREVNSGLFSVFFLQVFEYFASLKSLTGEIFMTPADLMWAVVPVFPPSKANRVREGYLKGESVPGEFHWAPSKFLMLFDTNNDGLISFAEYIFFVTLLSIPESTFSVTFKMFDLDNNGAATVLGVFVYGQALHKLDKLFKLILRLEFAHYDYNSLGTISAKDFALSMIPSADMKNIDKFLDRVDEITDEPGLRDIRVTFEEFKNFAELPQMSSLEFYKDEKGTFRSQGRQVLWD
ncbi:hypothetical protein RJ640_022218, partial [Escallonia rubra]